MEEFETRSVGRVSGAEIKALLNILLKLKLFFQISSFILRARINVSNDPTAVREKSSNSTIFQPRGGKMKCDSQSSCWRRRCVFKSCHRSALCVLRQWGRSKSGPILAAVSVGWRLCAWPGMKERAQSDSERITGRDEPPKSGSEVRQRRQDGQRTPGGRSCFYQRLFASNQLRMFQQNHKYVSSCCLNFLFLTNSHFVGVQKTSSLGLK